MPVRFWSVSVMQGPALTIHFQDIQSCPHSMLVYQCWWHHRLTRVTSTIPYKGGPLLPFTAKSRSSKGTHGIWDSPAFWPSVLPMLCPWLCPGITASTLFELLHIVGIRATSRWYLEAKSRQDHPIKWVRWVALTYLKLRSGQDHPIKWIRWVVLTYLEPRSGQDQPIKWVWQVVLTLIKVASGQDQPIKWAWWVVLTYLETGHGRTNL